MTKLGQVLPLVMTSGSLYRVFIIIRLHCSKHVDIVDTVML